MATATATATAMAMGIVRNRKLNNVLNKLIHFII
jgi:hypothetical protein